MAQKIEVLKARSADELAKRINGTISQYADDPRIDVTPIAVFPDTDDYVAFVRVEAAHKRKFDSD